MALGISDFFGALGKTGDSIINAYVTADITRSLTNTQSDADLAKMQTMANQEIEVQKIKTQQYLYIVLAVLAFIMIVPLIKRKLA